MVLFQPNTELSVAIFKLGSNNIILKGFGFKNSNNSFSGLFKYSNIEIEENLLLSSNYMSLKPNIINVKKDAEWNMSLE